MTKKLTRYDNVFINFIEHHNKLIVPILRELNLSTVKVRNTKRIQLKKQLEVEEKILLSVDFLTQYLVTNYFLLSLIERSTLDSIYDLIKSRNKDNILMASNMIYALVEDKKKLILEIMN